MARVFVAASSQRLVAPVAVSMPFTFALWFYTTVEGATNYAIAGLAGTSPYAFWLRYWCWDDPVPREHGRLAISSYNGSDAPQATTTSFITVGQWNHALAILTSSTSRTIYLNGGSQRTSTTANHNEAMTEFHLGCSKYWGAYSNYYSGTIAWPAVWTGALGANDIARLAAGVYPPLVSPSTLLAFGPLLGVSPEPEVRNGAAFAVTGATVGDNPRIFMPPRRRIVYYSVPAAGHPAVRRHGIWQPRCLGVEGVSIV